MTLAELHWLIGRALATIPSSGDRTVALVEIGYDVRVSTGTTRRCSPSAPGSGDGLTFAQFRR
ncbi:hypothetical protein HNR06_004948 [Nocardiopsis arvandica]|uniref:Uncharacterized protein n=1 Tax=Nocardiopsis sinuspersici TaxID=501010 RepID=A0A7Y9XGA2_9ACTN|nr:hypothetical protein [Nocardiopsis sinuspersici]NYH55359.1 hypothetical protein [Nocardiopsis sinuspersici]